MTKNSKRKLDKLSLDGILLSLTAAPTPPCMDGFNQLLGTTQRICRFGKFSTRATINGDA